MINREMRRLAILLLVLISVVDSSDARAADHYHLQALPIGDDHVQSFAAGINNVGQAVGHIVDAAGHSHAVLWSDGNYVLLPELAIDAPFSQAYRINNAGQIVGKAGISDGSVQATLWENLQVTDLGTISGEGDSFAADINEHGVVAGSSAAEVGSYAFTWTRDGGFVGFASSDPPHRLAVAGFNGINDRGLMVGTSYFLLSPFHAAFAREGDRVVTELSPPGRESLGMANAVNDAGTIVGYQNGPEGPIEAAIFQEDGTFELLGTLGLEESFALDVNQVDVIVGGAITLGVGGQVTTKALVYQNQQMQDLLTLSDNPDGWMLVEATAINDFGVIVGNGVFNGDSRAFMAIPVPEPTARSLAVVCGALVSCHRMRRERAIQPRSPRGNSRQDSVLVESQFMPCQRDWGLASSFQAAHWPTFIAISPVIRNLHEMR
jgi:probable HAF family extracellular repeat protein